jgi:hypothetical protein
MSGLTLSLCDRPTLGIALDVELKLASVSSLLSMVDTFILIASSFRVDTTADLDHSKALA